MSEHAGQLSPDFADRVLRQADRRLAKRRRGRWIAAATGLCAAVVGTISWIDLAKPPQQTGASPGNTMMVARAAPLDSGEAPANSVDALSYLFPDAEPLARFAAESSGENAADAGSLFEDGD